jgi:ketosteroid isomerase-like protein
MSQENVETLRETIAAYNRGDLNGQLDHLAPEFEFETSGVFSDTEAIYRGREGYVDFWKTFREPWESITIGVERIEDLGDRVLVLGYFHGRGRGSGVEVGREAAFLTRFRSDGLAVHIRTFANWTEALEAAGLAQ